MPLACRSGNANAQKELSAQRKTRRRARFFVSGVSSVKRVVRAVSLRRFSRSRLGCRKRRKSALPPRVSEARLGGVRAQTTDGRHRVKGSHIFVRYDEAEDIGVFAYAGRRHRLGQGQGVVLQTPPHEHLRFRLAVLFRYNMKVNKDGSSFGRDGIRKSRSRQGENFLCREETS